MRRKAFAKVTLSLQAVDRIGTIVHFDNVIVPIDLFDMVYLDVAEEMSLQTDKAYLPMDHRNTVYSAIMIMKERFKIEDNFAVRIVKNIPAQSGLGGGSADAATVIHLLDEMYHLNLSMAEKIDIARHIDEDTPFCLVNSPAHVKGMGDEIQPISLSVDIHYLVIKPAFGISTQRFLKQQHVFTPDPSISQRMIEACEMGDYDGIVKNRTNTLQDKVMKHYPRLKSVIKRMKKLGLEGVCMSGTGTSIVGLSQDIQVVRHAYDKLVFKYPFVKYGTIKAQDVVK